MCMGIRMETRIDMCMDRPTTQVHASMTGEVKSMREVWKSHFLSVFNAIDTDGSGTIDKEEFQRAVGSLQELGNIQVAENTRITCVPRACASFCRRPYTQRKAWARTMHAHASHMHASHMHGRKVACPCQGKAHAHTKSARVRIPQVVEDEAAEMQKNFNRILHSIFDNKLSSEQMFDRIDADHSGQISWDEFWNFIEAQVIIFLQRPCVSSYQDAIPSYAGPSSYQAACLV